MARTHELIRLDHPRRGALVGDLFRDDEPREHAVLFVHGLGSVRNGDKARSLEEACARRGWPFATFDLRGHGESSGTLLELTGSGLLEDLDLIRGALAERGHTRLCLVGSSMGGWACAWWAVRNGDAVPGLALIAPALHFPLGLLHRLTPAAQELWRRTGRLHLVNDWMDAELSYALIDDAARFPLETLTGAWRHPTLIFHGMEDDVVPYRGMLDVVQQLQGRDVRVHLFRGGDHRLVEHKDDMAEHACGFFARLVP